MISIYKENDKSFVFARARTDGEIITSVPQGLYFTVKNKEGSRLITKTIGNGISQNDDGSWLIIIDAADTVDIDVGSYQCDVKVKDETGREFTIVKPQTFAVLDVVTRKVGAE